MVSSSFLKMHQLLKKYQNDSKRYFQIMDILKYIYVTAYNDFEEFINSSSPSYAVQRYGESLYEDIVEGDDGILDLLDEILSDNRKEFADTFFDAIMVYIDMFNNGIVTDKFKRAGLVSSSANPFEVSNYIINIYAMLKSYHEHKDNFAYFTKIVTDISGIFGDSIKEIANYGRLYVLEGKKNNIDSFLSREEYYDIPKLHNEFVDLLDKGFLFPNTNFKRALLHVDYILEDGMKFNFPKEQVIKIADTVSKKILAGATDEEIYYSPILLWGNRFDYIDDKLYKIERKANVRRAFFNKIAQLDNRIFAHLNDIMSQDGEDSFITCMNIIFDSDSYYELNSKLALLLNVNERFLAGDSKACSSLIADLQDISHKEVVLDKYTITYPSSDDVQNLPHKPDTIMERMLHLYSELPLSINGEVIPHDKKWSVLLDTFERVNDYYERSDMFELYEDSLRAKLMMENVDQEPKESEPLDDQRTKTKRIGKISFLNRYNEKNK